MQQAVDVWETSICITGGAIRPEKCHWYVLDFQWSGSDYHLSTTTDIPSNLSVKDSNGTRQTIKRIIRNKYDKSEVTLGLHCKQNGDMEHQINRMKAKSQDWGDKITAGHMARVNVAIAFTTTIWQTLS